MVPPATEWAAPTRGTPRGEVSWPEVSNPERANSPKIRGNRAKEPDGPVKQGGMPAGPFGPARRRTCRRAANGSSPRGPAGGHAARGGRPTGRLAVVSARPLAMFSRTAAGGGRSRVPVRPPRAAVRTVVVVNPDSSSSRSSPRPVVTRSPPSDSSRPSPPAGWSGISSRRPSPPGVARPCRQIISPRAPAMMRTPVELSGRREMPKNRPIPVRRPSSANGSNPVTRGRRSGAGAWAHEARPAASGEPISAQGPPRMAR